MVSNKDLGENWDQMDLDILKQIFQQMAESGKKLRYSKYCIHILPLTHHLVAGVLLRVSRFLFDFYLTLI